MVARKRDVNADGPGEEEIDDIEAYIATFDEEARRDLAAADAAIDIAIFLHRARERRGLSQTAAAKMAGLHQQSVSRLERPHKNPQLDRIQSYLGALGYALELKAIDLQTGEIAAAAVLPPQSSAAYGSKIAKHFGTVTPRNRPEDWQAVREDVEGYMAHDIVSEDA